MTNESAILGLLADLYRDRIVLQAEIERLRQQLAATTDDAGKANNIPRG